MKYLIVGLGNIGDEYRHAPQHWIYDIGRLCRGVQYFFSTGRYGDVVADASKNKQVVLQAFIHEPERQRRALLERTGRNRRRPYPCACRRHRASLGAIRVKGSGSDAGHNGLKNIAQMLHTQAYPRLRFGIGNDFPARCTAST